MKMASTKNEKPSMAKPSPNTEPNVPVKCGQSRPISNDRIVPVTTPTANSATSTRLHRRASVRCTSLPVRSAVHSVNRTSTGKAIPKQTSGMCTANESACICRAWSR